MGVARCADRATPSPDRSQADDASRSARQRHGPMTVYEPGLVAVSPASAASAADPAVLAQADPPVVGDYPWLRNRVAALFDRVDAKLRMFKK